MASVHDSTFHQSWPKRLEDRIDVTNALAVLVVTALLYLAYHVSYFAYIPTYRHIDVLIISVGKGKEHLFGKAEFRLTKADFICHGYPSHQGSS